jgi:hypothetical protein
LGPTPTGAGKSASRNETNQLSGGVQMQSRTCLRSALPFALGVALAFNSAAVAGDLPKEGTYNVIYTSAGTYKATRLGKERLLAAWDENALSVGTGLLDHMTWHCWGLFNIANGMTDWRGYCVMTDPAGDQIAADVASDGKYAGISGSWAFVGHSPEFRAAAEGTDVQYGPVQGSYKLR